MYKSMAAPIYKPKIKVDTVRDVARKLASTQTGKTVTQTAFKKFLRSDKELRSLTYRPGSSHITQSKAKQLISTAAKKIAESDKMKLSLFSRKIGIKGVGPQGNVSKIGVTKAYTTGAKEEIAAEAPKGPSKEEVARQQRIQHGREILRQREQADQIRMENVRKDQARQQPQQNTAKNYRPPQIAQMGAAGISASALARTMKSDHSSPTIQPAGTRSSAQRKWNAAVLPFHNMSQMRELDILGVKLEETVRRTLVRVPAVVPYPRVQTLRALQQSGWTGGRIITPEFAKKIAKELDIQYIFYGTLTHEHSQAHVRVNLLVIPANSILLLADIRENVFHTFEMEEKVSWQVDNFFTNSKSRASTAHEVQIPSASEAVDLPL